MKDIFDYIDYNRDRFLSELFLLLSQPSISTQDKGVRECAELLAGQMKDIGITTKILPTAGFPVVFGELKSKNSKKTLLIYGHYDVQPPEPLELWDSTPFRPQIRKERIYGRGAADDKGQLFAHLKAVEAIIKIKKGLPIDVKFIFEGEEEIGSRNLRAFVEENKKLLSADYTYCSDGPMVGNNQPCIIFGVRGILYVEITSKGANRDVHSGNLGVFVPQPAWRIVEFLNTLKDKKGSFLIEGFCKDVIPPTAKEKKVIKNIPFDSSIMKDLGILSADFQEGEFFYEKMMFQPAINICGLISGYTGEGMKTIVPNLAKVKLDIRLVVNQDPDDIFNKLKEHAEKLGFSDLKIEKLGYFYPSRTPIDHPFAEAVIRAVRKGFNQEPIIKPCSGGSDPEYYFTKILNLPRLNVPYAPRDQNNHSPNENIRIEDFINGIKTTASLLYEISNL